MGCGSCPDNLHVCCMCWLNQQEHWFSVTAPGGFGAVPLTRWRLLAAINKCYLCFSHRAPAKSGATSWTFRKNADDGRRSCEELRDGRIRCNVWGTLHPWSGESSEERREAQWTGSNGICVSIQHTLSHHMLEPGKDLLTKTLWGLCDRVLGAHSGWTSYWGTGATQDTDVGGVGLSFPVYTCVNSISVY